VPEDMEWPYDAGQDVLYEFPGGPAHDATFSVADRQCNEQLCY
jgi:hypothetical protein